MNDRDNKLSAIKRELESSKVVNKSLQEMLEQKKMELQYVDELALFFNSRDKINEAIIDHNGLVITQDNNKKFVDLNVSAVLTAVNSEGEIRGANENNGKYYFDQDNKNFYLSIPEIARIEHKSLQIYNADNAAFSTIDRLIIDAIRMSAFNNLQMRELTYFHNMDGNDSESMSNTKKLRQNLTIKNGFKKLDLATLQDPIIDNKNYGELKCSSELQQRIAKAKMNYKDEIRKIDKEFANANDKIEALQLQIQLMEYLNNRKFKSTHENKIMQDLYAKLEAIHKDPGEELKFNSMKNAIINAYADAKLESKGVRLFQEHISDTLKKFMINTFKLNDKGIEKLLNQFKNEANQMNPSRNG